MILRKNHKVIYSIGGIPLPEGVSIIRIEVKRIRSQVPVSFELEPVSLDAGRP